MALPNALFSLNLRTLISMVVQECFLPALFSAMNFVKILTLFSATLVSSSYVSAQDLMAREATSDFQLKSSKTVKIIEQYQKKEEIAKINNIYGNVWSNAGVNVYKGMAKPEKLVVDLRDFSMPIKSRIITSNYGYRKRFHRNHYGIDIKGYTGDTIYAAFSGKVRVRKYDARGFGYYIVIRHSNGLETVYGHLSKQLVSENQDVKSGQPIGLCGNTGRSFGSHLHFETRILGESINPALMFDFAEQDITSDTYTYRSTESKAMPIATPIYSYADAKVEDSDNKGESSVEERISSGNSRKRESAAKHKVKQGENPSVIAKRYHMTVSELYKMNRGLDATRLKPGQILFVKK